MDADAHADHFADSRHDEGPLIFLNLKENLVDCLSLDALEQRLRCREEYDVAEVLDVSRIAAVDEADADDPAGPVPSECVHGLLRTAAVRDDTDKRCVRRPLKCFKKEGRDIRTLERHRQKVQSQCSDKPEPRFGDAILFEDEKRGQNASE